VLGVPRYIGSSRAPCGMARAAMAEVVSGDVWTGRGC
jgi:hypothetical protein